MKHKDDNRNELEELGGYTWEEVYSSDYDEEEWYEIDAHDQYVNGAFTEDGDQVYCDFCNAEMRFDPDRRIWHCKECANEITRAKWFKEIGACHIPGKKCLTQCNDNYPVCREWCTLYEIPEDEIR